MRVPTNSSPPSPTATRPTSIRAAPTCRCQRQRLCIARALLCRPKILILDDSTSAVDTRTDAIIRKGLSTYVPETTKIIIAQRIASVEDADLIVVMDGGTIRAIGTHSELLESSDIYREVYREQTKGADEE